MDCTGQTIHPPDIVPMDEALVGEVHRIEQLCFSTPWSLGALQSELDNHLAAYFVARRAGRVIGYAGLHHILDEGHITNVAVDPLCRRQGVAAALLRHMTGWAGVQHIRLLLLEVRASGQAAIALYERFGFRRVGRRKNYYTKPTEDALLMALYLQPEGSEALANPGD